MRINCHAHIFNAKSVFTSETVDILLRRITEMAIPDLIKAELTAQLGKALTSAGDYVDEEALFRNVVRKVSTSKEFKQILKTLESNDTLKLQLDGGPALQDYAVDGLVRLLEKIGDALSDDDKDAAKADIGDALAFLRIALQPSIRHVTDILMEQLTLQDAVIPLVMDITHDGGDEKLLEQQLADTSAQVLAYPGRIFPFVAVNTKRPAHFSIMEAALNGRGFVGVKLYPSLGYPVNSPEMFKVYAYCEDRGVPILMHCSEGGFYASNDTIGNSDPALWAPILEKHPNLKICFGHFGGATYLTAPEIPASCWTRTILELMTKFNGVYADIAYHSEPMDGGTGEQNYFKNLSLLLQNDAYRDRILFGTDFFLSRQRLTEKSYWKYFTRHLAEDDFRRIAEDNPQRYLGLPAQDRQPSLPIANYIRFVYQQRNALLSDAPGWLKGAIKELYGPTASLPKPSLGPKWSWNNKVHAYFYVFLAEGQLSERQKAKGFDTVGRLKLRDLAYWNKGFEANEIWSMKLKAMAENLDTFFRANGGGYEKKQDSARAIATLQKLFDNASTYIHEAGEVCDAIYNFA